jgi:hypothetical protein
MTGDPGRVPLSLIAVVCLSISAAIVPTLGPPAVLASDFRADRLTAQADGEMAAAVGEAGVVAAYRSAAAPLTEPTTTLPAGDPFIVGMRMQAAAAMLRRFPLVYESDGAEVSIHLPTRELPALVRSVQIESVDEGGAFRLTIEGLREHVLIDGTSHHRSRSHQTIVDLPVLALHRTATQLQQRHTAPVEAAGTTQTVTAAMSALATARGLGRYRGAPITNVVRNDQLALVVNAAALADQQAVLGDVAPSAHRGLRRAGLRVGITELGTVTSTTPVTDRLIAKLPAPTDPSGIKVRTGVSVDRGLVALTDDRPLSHRIIEAHQIHLETDTSLIPLRQPPLPAHPRPSPSHEPMATRTSQTVSLFDTTIDRTGRRTDAGYELARARGTVLVTTTAVRSWAAGTDRTTTTVRTTHRHRFVAQMLMRPAPLGYTDAPVAMAPLADSIADRAIARWGTEMDRIADATVRHDRHQHHSFILAPRSPGLQQRLTDQLAADRDRYVTHARRVDPLDALTQGPPPAAQLARSLPELQPPTRYRSIDERALMNIRLAYRQSVIEDLERRAAQTGEIAATLDGFGLQRPPTPHDTPAGSTPFDLELTPGYLSLRPVDGSHLSSVPNTTAVVPLVVRNQNLVSLPHHGLVESIVDRVAPDRTVDPRQAADVLDALPAGHPAAAPLHRALATAMDHPSRASVQLLRPPLGEDAQLQVQAARAEFPLTRQPQAFADGRLAAAMTDDPIVRAQLRVAQRRAMREPEGRIPAGLLDPIARGITEAVTDAATDRIGAAVASRLPTGVPISPTLSPWIATVNLWQIQAEGRYLRMTLTDPETGLRYVRAGQPVQVQVADETYTLGSAGRLHIEVDTIIAAAVPPGPPGIGDVEGGRDERSPGFDDGPHCLPAHPRCPYSVRNGFDGG